MISTGIDYPVSTGTITVTSEMLADVVASQDDPAVHAPRTKIGHDDPRFNDTVQADGTVLDGEPSLGTWTNLHLGDNNQTLYGDLTGVPRWFGEIMASAYPSRSIEGHFDVETVTGHKWKLVIDAVALLGVVGPGITTLDDLPHFFTDDGPGGIAVTEAKEGDAMSVTRSQKAAAAKADVKAQVNVDDIRRTYYESIENLPNTFWWWIRSIYVNPNELIIDDDEGGLYRVPFSMDDNDNVTFGDPTPVKVQYVDAPIAAASQSLRDTLVMAMGMNRILAKYTVRAESRPTNEGAQSMTPEQIALLRQRLNVTAEQLPDDASDAVLMSVLASGEVAEVEHAEVEVPTVTETQAPSIPEGMVLVDAEIFEQVRQQAQQGAAVASRLGEQERDHFLDDAIRAGKFPPSRREHYLAAWTGDAEGTRALVASLSPGLVPTTARGTAGASSTQAAIDYDKNWLTPAERSRVEASGNNSSHREMVTQGGD